MQPADFILFLTDSKRRFWNINAAGEVILNANPYPVVFSPEGWDDILIKNIRNKKYWALFRTVTTPFKFVEDAAKILKHIYYTQGAEASVYLVICELRLHYVPGVEYGFWYKQIFRSEIDGSTFQHDGPYVTASCAEDGFAKHLKSNENTVFEIPLDNDNSIYVKEDGVVLRNRYESLINPGFSLDSDFYFKNHLIGLDAFSIETENLGLAKKVSRTQVSNRNTSIRATSEYFMKSTINTNVDISYKIKFSIEYTPSAPAINPAAVFKIVVRRINENNISDLQEELFSRTAAEGISGNYTAEGSFSFPVREKDELYLFAFCNVQGATGDAQIRVVYDISDDPFFKAEFDYRFPATYIRCLRPQFVWNELVSRASNGEYTGEDCPYFGDLKNIDKVFSSGDGIRNIENPKFKISVSQFFDFWDTYDAVGIREKNSKVLLDRKKVLTDFVNIIDLGEISRPKTSFEKTFPFNELAVGYPDAKNENGVLNGKNEVNTTFVFSTGTSINPRKYDKISPVKVSCYEIENIRIEGIYKKTTDNKNDNEPFCLHINKELIPGSGSIPDHYELNRSYNAFVTGVDQAASLFNLELSPKNCINRSGDFLRSSGFKWDNRILKFISTDRNAAMAYLNGANVIVENADVTVAELADPFFNTLQISVETDAPEDLQDDLEETPGAVMQFSFEGDTYKILPMEIGNNPKTNKKQTYTGLSVPENDEKKLVDYYG